MKNQSLLLVPLLFMWLQWHAFAAENESPSAEMNSLVNSGQYQQAFDMGTANLEEWEGDPEFDFAYGLAALESGNPNEAVFALERVAATSTDGVLRERSRLELARAYFVTNNLTAAENLFNVVLANNPPTNVRQNIEAFLQLIDARRNEQSSSFTFSIASVVGSDDNINSATSNAFIDTPLIGQIELDPAGRETGDEFLNTTATMNYNYPFTRDRSLDFNLTLGYLDNFNVDFNSGAITDGSLQVQVAGSQAWDIAFNGSVNAGMVDLNAIHGTLSDPGGIISNSIDANLGGVFTGSNADAFVGGFDLIDSINELNYVEGLYTIER